MDHSTTTVGLPRPAATTEAKVPYDSGFGDFCFDSRSYVFILRKGVFEQDLAEQKSRVTSNFKPGTFDFFKLPPEVRLRIYQLVLEPIYQYCEKSKRRYIEIKLQAFRQLGLSRITRHPGRRSDYELRLVRDGNIKLDFDTWEVVQQIRNLSNTNCKLRKEFGSELWKYVHLKCTTWQQIAALESFLWDRPAASARIKNLSLRLHLDFERFEHNREWIAACLAGISFPLKRHFLAQDIGETAQFARTMNTASKVLRLESLSLTMDIYPYQLKSLALCRKGDWLETIRSLNVSKSFDLNFKEIDDEYGTYIIPDDGNWQQLEEKWSPVIRNLITPVSVRLSLTETEEYMKSRML